MSRFVISGMSRAKTAEIGSRLAAAVPAMSQWRRQRRRGPGGKKSQLLRPAHGCTC